MVCGEPVKSVVADDRLIAGPGAGGGAPAGARRQLPGEGNAWEALQARQALKNRWPLPVVGERQQHPGELAFVLGHWPRPVQGAAKDALACRLERLERDLWRAEVVGWQSARGETGSVLACRQLGSAP